MAGSLYRIEISIYFIIWVSSFSYSFYKVHTEGDRITTDYPKIQDLANGWNILRRKKDVSDYEWQLWIHFLYKILPWLFFHVLTSEIVRQLFIEALPICYLLTTMAVLLTHFPLMVSAFFILELTLFFAAMMSGSVKCIWAVGLSFLLFVNNNIKNVQWDSSLNENQVNLIHVSNGWFYIRCLEFVLSEVGNDQPLSQRFLNYLAYVFYLPCFFLGPFIPFDHFKFQAASPSSSLRKRSVSLFISSCIYLSYYFVYEISLHYLYCNAMHFDAKNYLSAGSWTLGGIGLCLAHFFYFKYLVIYGISTMIAKAENYQTPPPPKCIYHIHLYSKMWRHFDRGFYLFIFRRIYSPICNHKGAPMKQRILASFLCFLFVYIWHGGTISVLYWSTLNYFGLICEVFARYFWKTNNSINYFVIRRFSEQNLRRFQALAASPLWLLSVISNIFFFGGHDLGLLLVQQFFQGGFLFHLTLILIAYSMCQVSIETSYIDMKKHSE